MTTHVRNDKNEVVTFYTETYFEMATLMMASNSIYGSFANEMEELHGPYELAEQAKQFTDKYLHTYGQAFAVSGYEAFRAHVKAFFHEQEISEGFQSFDKLKAAQAPKVTVTFGQL